MHANRKHYSSASKAAPIVMKREQFDKAIRKILDPLPNGNNNEVID